MKPINGEFLIPNIDISGMRERYGDKVIRDYLANSFESLLYHIMNQGLFAFDIQPEVFVMEVTSDKSLILQAWQQVKTNVQGSLLDIDLHIKGDEKDQTLLKYQIEGKPKRLFSLPKDSFNIYGIQKTGTNNSVPFTLMNTMFERAKQDEHVSNLFYQQIKKKGDIKPWGGYSSIFSSLKTDKLPYTSAAFFDMSVSSIYTIESMIRIPSADYGFFPDLDEDCAKDIDIYTLGFDYPRGLVQYMLPSRFAMLMLCTEQDYIKYAKLINNQCHDIEISHIGIGKLGSKMIVEEIEIP
jgi:hypothetical protein